MNGWTKVILATALMVVALMGLNLAIWRRLREARMQALHDSGDGPTEVSDR